MPIALASGAMRWTVILEKYRTLTNYVGTVLAAWILSAIAAHVIGMFLPEATASLPVKSDTPYELDSFVTTQGQTALRDFYQVICERNIFDSQGRTPCTNEEPGDESGDGPVEDQNPVKSDIAATLVGTMVFGDPNRSFATIQPKSSQTSQNYYMGDSILEEGRIYAVERNKVYFIRNNHREYLEVENLPSIYTLGAAQPPGPTAGEGVKIIGDKAILSRAKLESTLGDLNQVIQQARMVPNFEGGAVNGFKIFAIRPGSIFAELGIKNGDVIQRINGTEINSVEKALPMLQLARDQSQITIDLTRQGTKKALTLEIR